MNVIFEILHNKYAQKLTIFLAFICALIIFSVNTEAKVHLILMFIPV